MPSIVVRAAALEPLSDRVSGTCGSIVQSFGTKHHGLLSKSMVPWHAHADYGGAATSTSSTWIPQVTGNVIVVRKPFRCPEKGSGAEGCACWLASKELPLVMESAV
jgi:hypothetical protein